MEQVAFFKTEHKIGHGHANAFVACHRAQQEAYQFKEQSGANSDCFYLFPERRSKPRQDC